MQMAANPDGMKSESDKAAKPGVNGDPRDTEKYRQAIREYYLQNGLQRPQRISAELQASRILRAVYSERQLQEVMVDFWSNHFNVFAGKGADRWLLVSYDRDTIRPNAMGKFSDLLLATAKSPAMLFYLDNFQSVSPNAQLGAGTGRGNQQRGGLFDLLRGRRGKRQNPGLRDDPSMPGHPNATTQQPTGATSPPQQPQRQRRGINENYARVDGTAYVRGRGRLYAEGRAGGCALLHGWTIFAARAAAVTQAMISGPRADMLRENAGKFSLTLARTTTARR